jgi:hypothetical protein
MCSIGAALHLSAPALTAATSHNLGLIRFANRVRLVGDRSKIWSTSTVEGVVTIEVLSPPKEKAGTNA